MDRSKKRKQIKDIRGVLGGGLVALGGIALIFEQATWWWLPVALGVGVAIVTGIMLYELEDH